MPGVVTAAVASGVLPGGRFASFTRTRDWPCNTNQYANGEVQVGKLASNFRSRWTLNQKLPDAAMETLRLFYLSHHGPHVAFYFYDPEEGPYDATGVATTGRYIVRFEGAFAVTFAIGRSTVPFQLVEVV